MSPSADVAVGRGLSLNQSPQTSDLSGWTPPADDEELLRTLVELSTDPVLVMANDGRILFANMAGQRHLSGVGPAGEGELPSYATATFDAQEGEVLRRPVTYRGQPAEVVVVRAPVHDRLDGRTKAQMLRADRLAAVGQLAEGVAHQVNNPAAFVTANLGVLGEHVDRFKQLVSAVRRCAARDPEVGREIVQMLDQAEVLTDLADAADIVVENLDGMSRISAVIRDLQTFSGIDREEVERIHLNEIVNASCNLVYNEIRHRATLIKDLGELPVMVVDREKLKQAFTSLLINAAQSIQEGTDRDQTIRIRGRIEGPRVVISVIDSGCGIPEAQRERIFEPFYTTKTRESGGGLGLTMAADIVRQHGGEIRLASAVGVGSQFDVILPLDTGLTASTKPNRESDTQRPVSTRRRVLLIDDEVMVLKAYRRILSPPHDVVTAAGAAEALSLLATDREFDAIVCDLMMPQIDGTVFYDRISTMAPDLARRIIFWSGGAFTDRTKSFALRVENPCLEKPVTAKALSAAIDRVVCGHDAAAEVGSTN